MSNKNRVPNIRFMGFKGEWAEKKFINCLAKIIDFRGKTPKKLGLSWSNNGKYRALSALNVKNGFIDKNIDVHFGNYDLYKKWMGNTELEKGDILFTTEAPVGNIAIIKDDEKYILSQRTIAFRVDEKNINGPFLLYKLNTVSTKNKLMSLSTGGTAQGISQKNLSYLFISVSNDLNEQQKIGDFFTKLDKLLDLQQQKIDKLELLKKALLQKLFPKHDTKIPELRYREFEDNWIIYSFSGLLIKNSSKNKNLEVENIESISNKNGFTKQSEQFDGYRVASLDLSNYYVIKGNQFAYNPSRINVGSIAYKRKGEEDSIISPLYVSFSTKNNINDTFLWYWFRTSSFKKQRIQFSEGGVRDTLPFENLKKMRIKLPRLNEQQKIGNLLSKVDQLIELENKKLQNFQQVKKCLLKNMFVE